MRFVLLSTVFCIFCSSASCSSCRRHRGLVGSITECDADCQCELRDLHSPVDKFPRPAYNVCQKEAEAMIYHADFGTYRTIPVATPEMGVAMCPCGKVHTADIGQVIVGAGTVKLLPDILEGYGARKPFILCDVNTWQAAGECVYDELIEAGYPCGKYVFPQKALEPDEHAVGAAVMHYDHSCDIIIGVGSGVINDIGKILSRMTGRKYIIVSTAPSMDGYASEPPPCPWTG